MNFKNIVYTEIYDKQGSLISKFTDKNLVVDTGKEIIRDCLIHVVGSGLRNVKLSTSLIPPSSTDTLLGGTVYDAGLQSNDSVINLEPEMYFSTDTLKHDQLNIPYKWTNSTGGSVFLGKIGIYDYNGGTERLFGALLLNDGSGASVPNGGFTLSKYVITIEKGVNDYGYLTDWGVEAVIHALFYNNVDYNLDYVGLGSGPYTDGNSINGLFDTTQATSILPSESNKLLTSFDYTDVGGHQVEEVGVGNDELLTGGTIISTSTLNNNNAFDGNIETECIIVGGGYIGKTFTESNIHRIRFSGSENSASTGTVIVQGSNNGTDWTSVIEIDLINNTPRWYSANLKELYSSVRLMYGTPNNSRYIQSFEFYSLNLFSKFPHSKTLLDAEQWIDTVINVVDWD